MEIEFGEDDTLVVPTLLGPVEHHNMSKGSLLMLRVVEGAVSWRRLFFSSHSSSSKIPVVILNLFSRVLFFGLWDRCIGWSLIELFATRRARIRRDEGRPRPTMAPVWRDVRHLALV